MWSTDNDKEAFRRSELRQGREICRLRMVLDSRRASKDGRFPVRTWVRWRGDKFSLSSGVFLSKEEYYLACGKALRKEEGTITAARDKLSTEWDYIVSECERLIKGNNLTTESFQAISRTGYNTPTIYSLWQKVAAEKSVKTKDCYLTALKRFQADMGNNIAFDDINSSLIEKWRRRMSDGTLKNKPINKTSVNIYLRSFRVVVNVAYNLDYVKTDPRQMFSGKKIGGYNSSLSRKDRYLTVEQWRTLWHCFENRGEGCGWSEYWSDLYLEALGMMLFMYLANGMNLRDVLNLRYDDFYFAKGMKMMRFVRHKTADRRPVAVVFPVLPEMRIILERLALPEEKDGLVFGYLQGKLKFNHTDKDTEEEIRLTGLYNAVIRERMKKVCRSLGMQVEPSATYCRHSFASNLMQAEVPKEYISSSMAHTCSSTTDNYIDCYSYETMVKYNSRLLGSKSDNREVELLTLLRGMSDDEIRDLLRKR